MNSLRMLAEKDGTHISGAERLLEVDELPSAAVDLLQRALCHPCGPSARISIKVDEIRNQDILSGQLLRLQNNKVASWEEGRGLAEKLLMRAGISAPAAKLAMDALNTGAAPDGTAMRGAMLIDAETGQRLEADAARGVRVSRMDLTAGARKKLIHILSQRGFNNLHVIEAITLATKVIASPDILAELCWSDDPDYLAGYVASQGLGYQRICLMKPAGETRGGRAFFVRPKSDLTALQSWLETQPMLISCNDSLVESP